MNTYCLKFADDRSGSAKDVEFHAADAGHALTIAQRESPGRAAELWQGGRKLCTIRRRDVRGDIWQIE